jgi:hypothetical protein
MSEDPDLDELKRQTSHGDRLDEAADVDRRARFRESLREELAAIDAGDRQKTVSVWDGNVAALLAALEGEDHRDELEDLGERLADQLDTDAPDDVDRSDILRLTLRAGLQAAAPEYLEDLRDALAKQAASDL